MDYFRMLRHSFSIASKLQPGLATSYKWTEIVSECAVTRAEPVSRSANARIRPDTEA